MKKTRLSLGSVVVFLLVAASFMTAGLARAQTTSQNATHITVAPALVEEVINPGDQYSSSIQVTNSDSNAKQYTVSVQDISGLTAGGDPIFSPAQISDFGVSTWVSIPQTTFTVPGNATKEVSFSIAVPKDAAPGGHYGAIFINYGAKRPTSNGAGVGYQVGTLIELRIAGQDVEAASIKSFTTDKGFYEKPQVTFTTTVSDDGNVLLRPRGPISITNMFGATVATLIMNNEDDAIFPSSSRTFSAVWNGDGMSFGKYDAIMSLTYGNDVQKTVTEMTSFWVIPIVPIVAVLGSIIFFIIIFVWSLKVYIRKRVNALRSKDGGSQVSLAEEEKIFDQNKLPFSRLMVMVVATIVFAIIFLFVLFVMFG
jgi:hypothetical protein